MARMCHVVLTCNESFHLCTIPSCTRGGAMYLPQSYTVALMFMIGSMLCWGSWANSMKLCPGYRFQLFYWDYVIGLFVGIAALGMTLGSLGSIGKPFLADVSSAPGLAIAYAMAGGLIF